MSINNTFKQQTERKKKSLTLINYNLFYNIGHDILYRPVRYG